MRIRLNKIAFRLTGLKPRLRHALRARDVPLAHTGEVAARAPRTGAQTLVKAARAVSNWPPIGAPRPAQALQSAPAA